MTLMQNTISQVCEALVGRLRGALCPSVITSQNAVGVCTPSDKGDFLLGVCLIDLLPSSDLRDSRMMPLGSGSMVYPTSYTDAFFMVTSYSTADIIYRAAEDAAVIGSVWQTLADTPVLEVAGDGESFEIPLNSVSAELGLKGKLWVYPEVPYRLSLLYKAGPVPIRSLRTAGTSRVWSGGTGG